MSDVPVEVPVIQLPELRKLHEPFSASELKYRVIATPGKQHFDKDGNPKGIFKGKGEYSGKTVLVVAFYVDARAVMKRLNSVLTPYNWQRRDEKHNMGVTSHLGVKINGEWIWKSDGADYTDIESAKGGHSVAFRRAAVNWGIGMYLYDVPTMTFPGKQIGSKWYLDNYHTGDWSEPELPAKFLPKK